MSDTPITAEHLHGTMYRLIFHARLGRGGYVRTIRSIDYPRLVVTRSRERAHGPVKRVARVDGVECATTAEIVERLNAPPPAPAPAEVC